MRGKTPKTSGPTAREIREALLDAEDQAAIARGVLEKLQDELSSIADERRWIEVRILRARNALVAPLIERLSEWSRRTMP